MPFQVDPMLIPMFGRGNLSKKFAAGGGVKSGVGTPTSSPDKLDEFNRKMQRELEEENRRFEESGGSEFYSAIRQPMQDINEKLNQTLEMYRMGRASEADVQKLLPFFSEYDIASQFGKTDTGGYRPSDINAPSTDRLREFIEIQKPTIDANRPDMFPYDPLGLKSQERILQMGRGGPIKSALTGIEKAQEAVKAAKKDAPLYSPKVLESTASRIADQLRKQNPKLTDEAIKQRSERLAAQKLQWERGQKPALEKEFGELVKAPSSASRMQKMQNVPEVVQRRIQKTQDFLKQPTEPWQPPRKELQAFERERIKDALEGFPGIEQSRFPRYEAPRSGALSVVEEIYQDPVNRSLIKGQIERGLPLGGETFYASLYPLKLAALDRGIPEEQFNQFIYSIAPASARNSIMNEMAVGQFLRDMNARGIPMDDKTVRKEMDAFKAKYGKGLSLMPVHREGVKSVLEGNQDLRELSKANIPTNYKIPTYGTQKAGDFGKSVVLDVHEAAGETRGSRFHPYFSKQGGFGPPEYGPAESQMLQIAEEMGIPGGMAQAGRWFGGGELTGLKSPRGDALDLFEKQAAYTLQGLGTNPTPRNVRNYILDMIETGEGVLMPWFKKEGMPDYRTEKKKGGAVRKGALAAVLS